MKTMTYQRKNNDKTVIELNSDIQLKMNNSYSFSDCAKVGLAIVGTVAGATMLANRTGILPSFSWSSNAPSDNSLDNPHQLMNPQDRITFTDNTLPVQPRHAKRAGFAVEFQINTYTTNDQRDPSVAALNSGDFVVVWQSECRFPCIGRQDGDDLGVYGQRYSGTGIPQGSEFQVNTYTTDRQWFPSIAALNTGGFVVVWESGICCDVGQDGDRYGIYGQRYSSTGVPQGGEFQINTYTISSQWNPSVTSLTTGDFVVTWTSNGQDGSFEGIYGQRYSSTGVPQGDEFQINTYTYDSQKKPSVAALSTGDFVVTWTSNWQDGSRDGIYGQRFSSTSAPQGKEFQVNTYTISGQENPSVVGLTTGDFVVTWKSKGQDGDDWGIYGQRYSGTGIPQGDEFQINTYTYDSQKKPSVASLTTGDFVVTWTSDGQDGSYDGIYGCMYFNDNVPPTLINNALTINEGETIILSTLNISTSDSDNSAFELTFTMSNVQYGQFERVSNVGVAVTSFTQQDIIDGAIQFVHGGSENQPTYDVSVSDGVFTDGPASASIIFNNVNDAPVLGKNTLTVNEGETVILSTADLSATDSDNNDVDLAFTMGNVKHGQFERASNLGVAITSFVQQDIIDGDIQFVHDGSENQPTYDVSVSDSFLSNGPVSANVTFSNNVNDAPVLGNNTLTVNEGQTVALNATNLSVTDSDNTATELIYTMSNVQNGQFERIINPVAIHNFTHQEIIDGDIQFVHDGSENQPTYDVSVSDGALSDGPASASVTFSNNINDTPVLGNNALTVNEGQTVALNATNLSATDSDNDRATLMFTVSNIQYGQFERISNAGIALTSFTQQEIIDKVVQFVHDGSTNQPTYNVSVSDGVLSSTASTPSITFTFVNDAPVLGNNSLIVNEGETVILDTANLSATDSDHSDADLIFTLSYIQHGQFERVSNAGVAITSFTQQELIDGAIQFVHDGNENQPTYDVTVSDGLLAEGPATANIFFTNINDMPSVINSPFILQKGETITITPAVLNAIDSDNQNQELIFNIANINGGYFRTTASDTTVIQFSMEQIRNNEIMFVSDGTALPEYTLYVTDGESTSASKNSAILYISQNQLVTKPSGITVLSAKHLEIQTQLAPTDLKISVSKMTYSRFENSNNQGVPISSFTLEELNSEIILFMHIGGEKAPQFTLVFEDIATNYTFPRTIDGNGILNYPPEVLNAVGTLLWPLNKFSNYTVPTTLFSDPDGQQLQFSVRKLNGNALPQWVQFNNTQNLLKGTPPISGLYSFKIIAQDPLKETAENLFYIDVRSNYDTEGANLLPIAAAIAGGTAVIGGCIAAGILYFKKAQDKKTRQQHKFAQLIRHHLKLQNINNFESEDGQHFVAAVQALSNELRKEQGIDIENMNENRLDELAGNISASAKNKITPDTTKFWKKSKISISEFADNLTEIAQDANRRLANLDYNRTDDVNIPMHIISGSVSLDETISGENSEEESANYSTTEDTTNSIELGGCNVNNIR